MDDSVGDSIQNFEIERDYDMLVRCSLFEGTGGSHPT